MRLLSDPHVFGIGKRFGVVPQYFFDGASNHPAKGVVGAHDPVLEVSDQHGSHVVLKDQSKSLFGLAQEGLANFERRDCLASLFQSGVGLSYRSHVGDGQFGLAHYGFECGDGDVVEGKRVARVDRQHSALHSTRGRDGDRGPESKLSRALAPWFKQRVRHEFVDDLADARAQRGSARTKADIFRSQPGDHSFVEVACFARGIENGDAALFATRRHAHPGEFVAAHFDDDLAEPVEVFVLLEAEHRESIDLSEHLEDSFPL